MNIRPALETEAPILSSLAMRAKAYWGYSAEALERWRPELAISPTDVRERPTFVAMVGAEIAGFYSLRPSQASWELDNLWVLPEFMHQGLGRALLSHALATAACSGASEVTVDADPNAERFYLDCGAIRRGEVPAPIRGQPRRVRPQFAFVQPDNALEADAIGGGAARAASSLMLAVALACATSTLLAQSAALSREAQANLVTKLWLDTCAKHFPDPAQIRVAAKTSGFQENPPYAQAILAGQAGTVWDVSIGPMAQNALILFEDGRCQVRGRRADSKSVNAIFEKVLQGINTPGVVVQRVSEKDIEQGGAKLKQIAYFVSKTGADQGWTFVATTSDSEAATVQAIITVGRSSKPK